MHNSFECLIFDICVNALINRLCVYRILSVVPFSINYCVLTCLICLACKRAHLDVWLGGRATIYG